MGERMVTENIPENGRAEIEWAPRVPKNKIRRLYMSDARGLLDEDLLEEVGSMLFQRCQSILTVADTKRGMVHCPRCERRGLTSLIERKKTHDDPRDQVLACPRCSWQTTWGEYYKSFKRHQLNPGGAIASFSAYIQDYAAAQTPQAKMLAVDRLIHEFHYSYRPRPDIPTRSVSVNLIEGKLTDVLQFLDELTANQEISPERQATYAEWRKNVENSRNNYIRVFRAKEPMIPPFDVTMQVAIRPCMREDLEKLEWFGLFARYRQLFADTFTRSEMGEIVMLVADVNEFPVGSVWIDLVKQREQSTGVLYALRVLPPLQNLGIGTRLIAAVEVLLQKRGYKIVELGVEKNNPDAKRLYERLGYRLLRDNLEKWEIVTPGGQTVQEQVDEWIMQKILRQIMEK
jgi:ribosomal protein S18 acetylase RimI-like enzyme